MTTHHAEVKDEAQTRPDYVNVACEFDTATLKPTYRLQWGQHGASNALAIARTLGFDRAVIAAAEGWSARLAKLKSGPGRADVKAAALKVRRGYRSIKLAGAAEYVTFH